MNRLASTLGIILVLFTTYSWSDAADNHRDAVFRASCCINNAIRDHPSPKAPCDAREGTQTQQLACIKLQLEFAQLVRDERGKEFCSSEVLSARKASDACNKKFSKSTCDEAFGIGKADAMRRCPVDI